MIMKTIEREVGFKGVKRRLEMEPVEICPFCKKQWESPRCICGAYEVNGN